MSRFPYYAEHAACFIQLLTVSKLRDLRLPILRFQVTCVRIGPEGREFSSVMKLDGMRHNCSQPRSPAKARIGADLRLAKIHPQYRDKLSTLGFDREVFYDPLACFNAHAVSEVRVIE